MIWKFSIAVVKFILKNAHIFASGPHNDVLQLYETFVDSISSSLFCDWFAGLNEIKSQKIIYIFELLPRL